MVQDSFLPVSQTCAALEISRSGYYALKDAEPCPGREPGLRSAIQEIALEFPGYGYRRVTHALRRQQRVVNHKKVLRIMREEHLLCKRKSFKPRTTNSSHGLPVYPNLTVDIVVTRLNQLWVADITYVGIEEGHVYLAAIIDIFSRKCIGWELSRRITVDLTLGALDMALTERAPLGLRCLIHHSDRGVQYAAIRYVQRLVGYGIRISMTETGNPRENAFAESFIDAIAERLSPEAIISRLKEAQPDLLCLTLQTQIFPHTLSQLRTIKESINCNVLGGGPHVKLYPRETMGAPEIDFALHGPAEVELPFFLRAFSGEIPFEDVPGLIYRKGEVVICNPPSPRGLNPGEAPWPAHPLMQHPLYYSLISQYAPYASLITSVGCPFRCTFCEQARSSSAPTPVRQVVAEIEYLVQKHGIRELEFFDPAFTLERKRVVGICQGLLERGVAVKWSARIRADQIDEELASLMASAGCIRLYLRIESANEKILAAYRKEFSVKDAICAVRVIQKAGIRAFGFFLFGAPEETEESLCQSIRLAKKLDLDYVQFNKLIAAPNTILYEQFFGTAADYWGQMQPQSGAPLVCRRFSEEELERWIRKAYLAFYFRPGYIWKGIRRARSPAELRRAGNVALSLLGTTACSLLPGHSQRRGRNTTKP